VIACTQLLSHSNSDAAQQISVLYAAVRPSALQSDSRQYCLHSALQLHGSSCDSQCSEQTQQCATSKITLIAATAAALRSALHTKLTHSEADAYKYSSTDNAVCQTITSSVLRCEFVCVLVALLLTLRAPAFL
jgi:hypothetical protein